MENDNILVVEFPFSGYNLFWSYVKQPTLTSPILLNIRAKEVSENKMAGGQRPGKAKVIEDSFSDNRPILRIIQVGITYIPPEE